VRIVDVWVSNGSDPARARRSNANNLTVRQDVAGAIEPVSSAAPTLGLRRQVHERPPSQRAQRDHRT
jgi:hypothetical protein